MDGKHSSVFSHELVTVSDRPYNAETPLPALLKEITPSELVYVRNHFEVPELEVSEWTLKVTGSVRERRSISHSDLRTLPSKTLRMTLECAGNGRRAMDPVPAGTPWGYGAVSIVEFTGTPVSNVLELAGISDEAVEAVFHGADRGEVAPGRMEPYVRSLPLEVALSPDTILAWEMNGEPLTTDHGFPLRMVVPGWYGMASVKWLEQIVVSKDKFGGFFQDEHYVYSEEDGTPEGELVRHIRVRSLILDATDVEEGKLRIVGIAWTGEGTVSTVEVSWDGGAEWHRAELDRSSSPFGLQRWRILWAAEGGAEYEFVSRATDSLGNVQPITDRWNRGGYGNNGLHALQVTASGLDGE
ncbi:MAG: sulfite oxidase [Chloroflexi bacterium]|nr:MAG: sulfite oxidase [Chloroflexota bacterium]